MEQASALAERIRNLKHIAASMHEGTIHTEAIPEIDKILALPAELEARTVGQLEALGRQVREYEQAFDSLGYTLLDQLMPTTGVSSVFSVVSAADRFKRRLDAAFGQTLEVDGKALRLGKAEIDALTRYSLSIGTPPSTDATHDLVSSLIFGQPMDRLFDYVEVLDCDRRDLEELLSLLRAMVEMSMHYCTAEEERAFLRDAAEFNNFEGARLFNRLVITESPERVIALIERHVFDKVGQQQAPPLRVVEGVDRLDAELIRRMRKEPNQVFVAKISRVPHRLFDGEKDALRVAGRLILIDCSARARRSNTTIVFTLFPHVARTLRNIQTRFAGRPASTQLQLRRLLERFSAEQLDAIAGAIAGRLEQLEAQGVLEADIDEVREQEWMRFCLEDYLTLK